MSELYSAEKELVLAIGSQGDAWANLKGGMKWDKTLKL